MGCGVGRRGREEARFAHDLESNSACDKSSHLALKIEGALPPEFSIHLQQVLSAILEVTLCGKHRRRHLTGLSRWSIGSQGSLIIQALRKHTPQGLNLFTLSMVTFQQPKWLPRFISTPSLHDGPVEQQGHGNNRLEGMRINQLN